MNSKDKRIKEQMKEFTNSWRVYKPKRYQSKTIEEQADKDFYAIRKGGACR